MKGSINRLVLVFALIMNLLVVLDKPSFSAESGEKETLRGVNGFDVFVRVRAGDAGADQLGITQDQLQTDLQTTLKKAGIRVMKNAGPYLLLSVSLISISHPRVDGILAYVSSVQLKFRQRAVLDTTGTPATVTTWDEIRFGARSPTKHLEERFRKSIDVLVDSFVNDYLAANSVKGPERNNED